MNEKNETNKENYSEKYIHIIDKAFFNFKNHHMVLYKGVFVQSLSLFVDSHAFL